LRPSSNPDCDLAGAPVPVGTARRHGLACGDPRRTLANLLFQCRRLCRRARRAKVGAIAPHAVQCGAPLGDARFAQQIADAVVGSPAYLRRRKRPERIDDLRRHACLRMRRSDGSIAPWSFVDGNRTVEAIVSGPLIANDFPTMLGAAIEGVGLAQVPAPIAADAVKAGKLVHVLKPFAPMAPGVFLYFPGRHQMMPKLRAFIDHVKSRSDAANKTRIHVDDKRTRGMKMR
jgi:LysR substrate binding domain-containing protein